MRFACQTVFLRSIQTVWHGLEHIPGVSETVVWDVWKIGIRALADLYERDLDALEGLG